VNFGRDFRWLQFEERFDVLARLISGKVFLKRLNENMGFSVKGQR